MKMRLLLSLLCGLAFGGCGDDGGVAPCTDGQTRPCVSGGSQVCNGGVWGACETGGTPMDSGIAVMDSGVVETDAGTPEMDAGQPGTCADGTAENFTIAVTSVPVAERGSIRGINIDDLVSDGSGEVCAHDDFTDPHDMESGVDAASSGLVRTLTTFGFDINTAIREQNVRFPLTITGIDNRENDPCVSVAFGDAEPIEAAITDGHLQIGPLGSLTVPIYTGVTASLDNVHIEIDISADGLESEAVLAGSVTIDEFTRAASEIPGVMVDIAQRVAMNSLDVIQDGECNSISFSFLGETNAVE